MKTAVFQNAIKLVGIPIVLPTIAVAVGTLKPIFGVVAAVALISQAALGQVLGRFLFSAVHASVRGVLYWVIVAILIGVWSGVGLSTPLGVLGGTVFGVSLGLLIVIIGYLESKSQ